MKASPARTGATPAKSARDRPVEVLLIDDTPSEVDRTIRALRKARLRCRVRVAETGDEALELLRRKRPRWQPDLILLDWYLPKKEGREVLEEIKSDPTLRRIPIVILSVSDHPQDICAAYDGHANSFVTKPADFEQFARAMKFLEVFWKGRRPRTAPTGPSAHARTKRNGREIGCEAQNQPRRPSTRRKSG
ncbi:MAG: response regulator [Gemmataceae bacterium]|nr:response regulator [Gemmataceae bacterium]